MDHKREVPFHFAGKKVFFMKLYDAKCPLCGTVNRRLYLDETDGWMECEHCREPVRVPEYRKRKKLPVPAGARLAANGAAASA